MKRNRWGVAAAAAATVAIASPALAWAQTQQLHWTDCSDYLDVANPQDLPEGVDWECAHVQVPVDYSDPDGRQTQVAVSRIPAQNPGEDRGVLMGNPGGPGAQALDFWLPAATADGPSSRLHEDYDLVAVEPRGLGYSGGIACDAPVTEVLDPADAYRACMSADPEYVESLTTENTARDMESVRRALAADEPGGADGTDGTDDAIDYVGYSYGTYLGATYATLYPEESGRFVLDSAVDPDWVWNEQAARQAEARKDRTNDMFAWIADHDDTYHLGDTPLKVFEKWKAITDDEIGGGFNLTPPDAQEGDLPEQLRPIGQPLLGVINSTAPARARVDGAFRQLTGQDDGTAMTGLGGTTMEANSTRQMWPIVAERMQDIEEYGPGVPIEGGPVGEPPQLTTGDVLFTAVTCNENPQQGDPVQAALGDFNAATGGNAFDVMAQRSRGGADCEGWPASTQPIELDGSKLKDKPLVIQSIRDAMTPYPGGEALAKAMDGVLVTVQGGDHGVFGTGNHAVDEVVTDYLVDGTLPKPGTVLPETPIHTPLEPFAALGGDGDGGDGAGADGAADGEPAEQAERPVEAVDAAMQQVGEAAAQVGDATAQGYTAVADAAADAVAQATGGAVPDQAVPDQAVSGRVGAAQDDGGEALSGEALSGEDGSGAHADTAAEQADPVAGVQRALGQAADAVTQAVSDAAEQVGQAGAETGVAG